MKPFLNKTFLIADDEKFLRETIAEEFKYLGAKVFEASSGEEAFAIYQREEVDVVFTDYKMPNGNGIFLIKSIRSLPKNPNLKIFLCTGFSDHTDDDITDLKIDTIFPKPFDWDKIQSVIEEHLAKIN